MAGSSDFGSRYRPDGTQSPPPSPAYPDATFGLSGGTNWFRRPRAVESRVEIARPIGGGSEDVRAAMRAAMDGDPSEPRVAPGTSGRSGERSQGRQQSRGGQVQRQAGQQQRPDPTVASGIEKPRRRQNLGCAIVALIVLAIVLFNIFSGLGGWIDALFH